MGKKSLKIHSENILPIIKKWLYSEKDIFVRELVSNACDAIGKLRVLRDSGEAKALDEEFRIDVIIDKEARTLKFIDTGIGMDSAEVEKYIAQIAFSGAEDFLSKYKSEDEKDQIIGHFGLGFYSAYMAAEKVEIETFSYKEGAEPVFWSCDGSSKYLIKEGSREKRGTEITLFIDKENDEFLEEARIKQILSRYCSFLPCPIFLGDFQINEKEPLWVKPASECTDEEYIDFYKQLYPGQGDPLFWVHLNVDYPFNLRGILYFPKIHRNFDFNRNTMQLFCNRVFVSDDCKDLVPDYLLVLKGAIDSPDIPLNVSRSYLQMDRTVRQLSSHVSKKISDRLSSFYKTDREKFLKCWSDISILIKLGAIQDEKFYNRVKEFLVWKNLDGEWTTAEEYIERNKEKCKDKVFYVQFNEQNSQFLKMYQEKGIEVLFAESTIDAALINTLEKNLTVKFQRVDGAIDDAILDSDREKSVLDNDGKTEAGKIADYIRENLDVKDVEVEAKSLSSDSLPAFVVIDESARRLRDYMKMSGGMELNSQELLGKHTLVVNTNNKLISSLNSLGEKKPELAKEMVRHLYDLAMLSQREMQQNNIDEMVARTNNVIAMLVDNLE